MAYPLVSILLPSLNAREFLEARIDSLLKQSYATWEAIVLDSGSTDGSWELFESTAANDSRFRLNRIPREGLYAALNRGMELAKGEFLHFAPCDDTMAPEFLAEMLKAFGLCPEAGIAVCDVRLINRTDNDLSADDLAAYLPRRSIKDLLNSDTVRTAFTNEKEPHLNYRPAPHDCLIHFGGRSVYFSLTQLVIRTALAKTAGPFETTVGSVADFGWLLRLTNLASTVHLPQKLATWRFHGNQLSLYHDDSRVRTTKIMCDRILPEIRKRYPGRLTPNDARALLLPCRIRITRFFFRRALLWLESATRLIHMIFARPVVTTRALFRTRFRFGTKRHSLIPMILLGAGLTPRRVNSLEHV